MRVASRFLDAIALVRDAAATHGFRVALIGGFALPFHGVRRLTGDVDFLVELGGAEPLHAALAAAGYDPRQRTRDTANYRSTNPLLVGVDVIYARRPPTLAMLARASVPPGGDVPVVDVEGLIGLKLQALVNDPMRQRLDEEDIVSLLAIHLDSVDRALLERYFTLFGREDALARYLDEAEQRRS